MTTEMLHQVFENRIPENRNTETVINDIKQLRTYDIKCNKIKVLKW